MQDVVQEYSIEPAADGGYLVSWPCDDPDSDGFALIAPIDDRKPEGLWGWYESSNADLRLPKEVVTRIVARGNFTSEDLAREIKERGWRDRWSGFAYLSDDAFSA